MIQFEDEIQHLPNKIQEMTGDDTDGVLFHFYYVCLITNNSI
jgi:hypothetical protein